MKIRRIASGLVAALAVAAAPLAAPAAGPAGYKPELKLVTERALPFESVLLRLDWVNEGEVPVDAWIPTSINQVTLSLRVQRRDGAELVLHRGDSSHGTLAATVKPGGRVEAHFDLLDQVDLHDPGEYTLEATLANRVGFSTSSLTSLERKVIDADGYSRTWSFALVVERPVAAADLESVALLRRLGADSPSRVPYRSRLEAGAPELLRLGSARFRNAALARRVSGLALGHRFRAAIKFAAKHAAEIESPSWGKEGLIAAVGASHRLGDRDAALHASRGLVTAGVLRPSDLVAREAERWAASAEGGR